MINTFATNNNCNEYNYLCKLDELLTKLCDSTDIICSCFTTNISNNNVLLWNTEILDEVTNYSKNKKTIDIPLIIIITIGLHSGVLLIVNRKLYSFGLNQNPNTIKQIKLTTIPDLESYGLIQPTTINSDIKVNTHIIVSPDFIPNNISKKGTKYSKSAIIRTIFPFEKEYLKSILDWFDKDYVKPIVIVNEGTEEKDQYEYSGYMTMRKLPDCYTQTRIYSDYRYERICALGMGGNCASFIEEIFPDKIIQSIIVTIPSQLRSVTHHYGVINDFIKNIIDHEIIDYHLISDIQNKELTQNEGSMQNERTHIFQKWNEMVMPGGTKQNKTNKQTKTKNKQTNKNKKQTNKNKQVTDRRLYV